MKRGMLIPVTYVSTHDEDAPCPDDYVEGYDVWLRAIGREGK